MKTTYHIEKMDCPTEEQLIRSRLKGMEGIDHLSFDLVRRNLTISHQLSSTQTLITALASIGMEAEPVPHATADVASESTKAWKRKPVVSRSEWMQLGLALLLALFAEILALLTAEDNLMVAALALIAIALGGREMLVKGWRAVRAFSLGINFLMTIAVTGALLIQEWPEAAMVTVLFALAEKIEVYALDRSRGAIRSLMELSPDTALVQQADGMWKEIRTAAVKVGQRLRIRPGERIPLDGTVVAGTSTVNQAPITGESMPVEKSSGEDVFAGTINERGSLEIEVTHQKQDTTLSRIIRAVQDAQAERGTTQRFVDQFAQYYTPAVVIAAVLIATLPPLFLGGPFTTWFYRALVLLVIACPCALVISTPVTIVSGLAAAARRGMLIKGGAYLESGYKLRVLALDKTGTLTEGRPFVTDIIPLADRLTKPAALQLAARLEAPSEHPIARAILEAYNEQEPTGPLPPVTAFESVTGHGVSATLDGNEFHLGNHRYAHVSGVCTPALEEVLRRLEEDGKTAIVLFDTERAVAVFGIADKLRDTSTEALQGLHEMGLKTVMLTGDNQTTAQAIARAAGIDDVRGDLLPEDKLDAIEKLRDRYGTVGMVGDGINDAPALAKADIGFAMGAAGTDTAIETADIALMEDDLRKLPAFLRLSRQTARVLWQNIAFAIGIKVVFFALALGGIATLWMAVFADMGASLLVTFNGLRLLRRPPTATPQ